MLEQDSARQQGRAAGDVRAFDVRTGKLRWSFTRFRTRATPATATWENDSWKYTGAGNVWSMISVDDDLGLVYLPTTGGTNDMYGGHRLGDNLYTSSIVALDAKTGKRVWHFQTVHHDLFDYDNPAAPILVDITRGRPTDQGARAGDQAGLRVRARSRDRQAGLADRRAAGAAVDRARREDVADAAGSDEAAAVRASGAARRRPHRLHAGAQGARRSRS